MSVLHGLTRACQINPNGTAGNQFSESAWGLMPSDKAVVFLMHLGYYFAFFVTDGRADDPPSLRISGGRASSATEGYLILDLA